MRNVLLTPVTILGFSLTVCLPAGATTEVNTAEQAIAVGVEACVKQVSANGDASKIQARQWHAKLTWDHWEVWTELDEEGGGWSINVKRDGSPADPNDCNIVVTTHERQRHQ